MQLLVLKTGSELLDGDDIIKEVGIESNRRYIVAITPEIEIVPGFDCNEVRINNEKTQETIFSFNIEKE